MKREKKQQTIKELNDGFSQSQASFLVGYRGLNVGQITTLRKALRKNGGSFKVAKVTLMERTAQENSVAKELAPYMKEQVALVFANQEPSNVAKYLYDFSKEHGKLDLIAGYFEDKILDSKGISVIATLPSKDVLLAQLCGTIKAPIAALTRLLSLLQEHPHFVNKEK